jgi:predicted Fe-Mo cluster-binding NifX family protein
MVVAVPVHNSRVAPLLDVAQQALVVRLKGNEEAGQFTAELGGLSIPERVDRLHQEGVDVVICAGLCGHLRRMLEMWGIRVVPGVVGDVEQVVRAFRAGALDQPQFWMPGCRRARRRWGRRGGGGGW